MALPVAVTIDQWLQIRAELADIVKQASPQSRTQTRIAEQLMQAGVVDTVAILDRIGERVVPAEIITEDEE